MTSTDEPFELPDLTDVMEMERIVKQLGKDKTAAELEGEIIRSVDQIRDEAVQLIRNEHLAVGDAIALRPAVKWLQTSLLPLFTAGALLPPNQQPPYLARLRLVIMAAYNIGGFTRRTRTVEQSVRKETHARIQRKGTKAAQVARAPDKTRRHELIRQIWSTTKIKTATHIHRQLEKQGLNPLPTAKTVRNDLKELGLVPPRMHLPKDR